MTAISEANTNGAILSELINTEEHYRFLVEMEIEKQLDIIVRKETEVKLKK